MPVLTVANSKGGTGKTLVCAVLCARLASDGVRVAAIDSDPNRTLYEWRSQVYEGPAFECRAEPDAARLAHMIPELADTYPLLVIDTAGFGNQIIIGVNHPIGDGVANFKANYQRMRMPVLRTVMDWSLNAGPAPVREFLPSEARYAPFTDDKAPVEQLIDSLIFDQIK